MGRRTFIQLLAAALLLNRRASAAQPPTLLTAPMELAGAWGDLQNPAARVLARVREVALADIALLSGDQPDRIRIDEHSSGSPAIWLHDDHTRTAWIIVDVGPQDWCKLAYQFGHELGHVLCNSWEANAKPKPPSQWLEEAMAEAFSLRTLGLLAASWERNPPFAGDAAFANAIREYRASVVAKYTKASDPAADSDLGAWFGQQRSALDSSALTEIAGPMIRRIATEFESDKACVEDLGALNRWPERSGIPIEEYLSRWQASCAEVHAAGHLPARLKTVLNLQ